MCKNRCGAGEGCYFASLIRTQKKYFYTEVAAKDPFQFYFKEFPDFLDKTRDLMVAGDCHSFAFTAVQLAYFELKTVQAKYKREQGS
jgi:hypothetical protein